MFLTIWNKKIIWSPFQAAEKSAALCNPYCGLYTIYRFFANPDKNRENGISKEKMALIYDQQICLIEINLIDYNNRPLSAEALKNIEDIFRYFIMNRKQLIVRFVYDWEGRGIISEPNDIGIILGHMEQLSPVLKELERHIYILQGLFIGSWGEMHNSRYLGWRSILALAKKLHGCSGRNTQIALRCPSFWRTIAGSFKPLDEKSAFSDMFGARFALFNDGMLASETDFGTYGHISSESGNYKDKWIRRDELDFQNRLCRFVSNGGEVINDCSYNDAAPAIEYLRKIRVSYLHCDYDTRVLNKWKVSETVSYDPAWKNQSAYEYIKAHLGYRFLIKDIKLFLIHDRIIKVLIKIRNTGFAPCYHKFDVKIAFESLIGKEFLECLVNTDTRFWMPDEDTEIQAMIPKNELKGHKYILCFSIYDGRTGQFIRIANGFKRGSHEGYYRLGYLKINV